jgi:hypothetical protein
MRRTFVITLTDKQLYELSIAVSERAEMYETDSTPQSGDNMRFEALMNGWLEIQENFRTPDPRYMSFPMKKRFNRYAK